MYYTYFKLMKDFGLNDSNKYLRPPLWLQSEIWMIYSRLSGWGGSIVASDGVVGNSLLIAGRIQNRAFPEVVLERTVAFEEICRVSVGEGLVIEMAEETVNILSYPEKQ